MYMTKLYSEGELVEGCKKRDPKIQRALYASYHRKMYGVCLRYTDNSDDAMDILQEGFVTVYQKIDKFEGRGSLEGWIRRIMVNQAIGHYRKKSRYFMVDIEEAWDVGMDETVFERMGREELLQLIQDLPPGYRTVFNLYAVEGYTHKEIGKMMNISPGTSKSQFSRARVILQKRIINQDNSSKSA